MGQTTTTEQDEVDQRWEDLPESARETFEARDTQDIETLRNLHQDVQQTLNNHIQALPGLSKKALQIIRLNGVILTILLAASSQLSNLRPYTNWVTLIGLTGLLLSTLVALWGYRSVEATIGLGSVDVKFTLRAKMQEREYLEQAIKNNIRWVNEAEEANKQMGRIVTWSLRIFVGGLVLILIGTSANSSVPQVPWLL